MQPIHYWNHYWEFYFLRHLRTQWEWMDANEYQYNRDRRLNVRSEYRNATYKLNPNLCKNCLNSIGDPVY
jgi:hypothetical protein